MATIQQTYKQVGKYFLNGKDMFTTFGVVFAEKAYAQLLKLPQSRDEYVQVFADQNGSQRPDPIFFQTLTHTLPFVIIGTDYNDILNKYEAFRNELLSITYHLLEVPRLGKLYRLRYSNMSDFDTAERIMDQGNMVFTFKIDFLNDTPTNNSIFRTAFEAAKAAGYDVDENMFDQAVAADLPYSYQKEAEVILAPGISKSGKVAGVDRNGNIVEFTATRAGTATYIAKDGLLKTAKANEQRVDYSLGEPYFLIESPSQNLIKYSRLISAAFWNAVGVTREDNIAIGRDGQLSASKVTVSDGAITYLHNLEPIPVTAGAIYSISFWVKKGTKVDTYKYYAVDADHTDTIIKESTDYTSLINRDVWTKIEFQVTIPVGTANLRLYIQRSGNGGDTGGDFYVTDIQLEQTLAATSTIPTNGSVGVRSLDGFQSSSLDLLQFNEASVFENVQTKGDVNWTAYKDSNSRFIYHTSRSNMALYDGGTSSAIYKKVGGKYVSAYDATQKNIYNDGVAGSESNTILANLKTSSSFKVSNSTNNTAVYLKTLAIFSRKFTGEEAKSLTK